MGRARIHLSGEMIRDWMGLPDDVDFVGVERDESVRALHPSVFQVIFDLEGEGIPDESPVDCPTGQPQCWKAEDRRGWYWQQSQRSED